MSDFNYTVFGSLQFEAIHCWPEAPTNVEFLRSPHRHIFHVKFVCDVTHADRDIEFITMKRQVERFCSAAYAGKDIGRTSCETIAESILVAIPQIYSVTVSEDNENGATVSRRA